MVEIKVPARVCFFGDHQDYLGLPVIAGTINRFIGLKATPNSQQIFHITLLDLDEVISISLNDELNTINQGDYFRSAMCILKEEGLDFSIGYNIEISGNIPVNAGLSSSSALVVAWIRFLVAIQHQKQNIRSSQIGHWAYKSEVLFFGQPGGLMDQYTIAQGGLLFIDTKNGKTTRLMGNLGKLVVAESGLAKETLNVLGNARIYAENALDSVKKANSEFNVNDAVLQDYQRYIDMVPDKFKDHWYATIHNYNITLKAKCELEKADTDKKILGKLMNEHQKILQNQIQNTPKKMMEMMSAAKESGALGTKIIGSGGGGCMLAMINDDCKDNVIQAFLKAGAVAAYEVELTDIV